MALPAGWIVPDWPAPANVRAVCTTRAGGCSAAPYDSLNLGDHVGDDPAAVSHNRAIFSEAISARPVFLQQVHGWRTMRLAPDTPDGTTADGCGTTETGIACTIMVADCLPMLFARDDGRAVAAGHAGWRSLAGTDGEGIVESVWQGLCGLDRSQPPQPGDVIAWLGPCIGPETFEVGPEVKAAFAEHDPQASSLFTAHAEGKWLADLQGLARRKLQALGITRIYGNDGSREWCTASNPSRFFSHRRDRVSGRLAAAVWLA